MTDDPRSHQYNDADWTHEIDSKQRAGTTGQTLARRHGEVSEPEPSDGDEPNDHHNTSDGGFDGDGIPEGI
jgi:hypothetical protein